MASIKSHLKRKGLACFCFFVRAVVPVKRKKVLFSSFLGKSYSCNPRAISEMLHDRDPSYRFVWCFADPKEKRPAVPSYVKCVRINSLSMFYHQLTSGFWVDNYLKTVKLKKRPHQYYIQTWHGDRAIKKILADMFDHPEDFRYYESDQCDLALSGSTFADKMYLSAFRYRGELLKLGCPRNDILVNGDAAAVKSFREEYNIPSSAKLLLYAPTFRDANKTNSQQLKDLNMRRVLNAFEKNTGDKWVLLLRGHTGRQLQVEGLDSSDIIDVTDCEDSKYVLLTADAVLSDYSSVATDFVLQKRPTFLFISDMTDYEQSSRSLYFQMEDSPFWYARNEEELLKLIADCTPERAAENCQTILDFYGAYETGKATNAVCDYIIQRTKQKNIKHKKRGIYNG